MILADSPMNEFRALASNSMPDELDMESSISVCSTMACGKFQEMMNVF